MKLITPRLLSALFAVALATSSLGCSTVPTADIKSQAVAAPRFVPSAYKSFGWFAGGAVLRDPLNMWSSEGLDFVEETKFLIDEGLRKRGMSVGTTPDLYVAFLLVNDVNELKKVESERAGELPKLVGVGQGALVIELIDAQSGQTVWMGAATADTESGRTAEVMKKRLRFAVESVLGQLEK